MKIISYIFIAILTGALALLCSGLVANACVRWYNISSFEGKAGFIMVSIALLGGLVGIVIGLITTRIVASGASPGFLKGLGLSCGIVLAASALAVLVSWLLADIPPKIDGEELDLLVEYRLPAGKGGLPEPSDDTYLALGSLSGKTVRKKMRGKLDLAAARYEDGYLILPGSVYIFTSRGKRLLYIVINDETSAGFIVPLPRRPGPKFEKWSDWILYPEQDDPKWQGKSYRFRVQREGQWEAPVTPLPKPEDKFTKLDPGAPLMEWLKYAWNFNQPDESFRKAMSVIENRQDELAQKIRSKDKYERESGMVAAAHLSQVKPVVSEAVLAEGRDIEALIRRFNEMTPDDPKSFTIAGEILNRFSYWNKAWWNVHQRTDIDGRPPVQNILDLAAIRAKSTSMDEVVINARAHLNGIPRSTGEEK